MPASEKEVKDVVEFENVSSDVSETSSIKEVRWYDTLLYMFYWYPSYLKASEKKLLFKLDIVLLTYICSSYFVKALDKANITNAYVTGMQEDINMTGNDLSYAKSLYSAGYVVSMSFGMMLVTRPWARLLLPVIEVIWGVLTFCSSAVKTPSQLYALRFLIGLAEGPVFPGIVYILGSWYRKDEIYRRVMAFSISSAVGGMFSGYLQSAAYSNLSGVGGLAGWRWGFIIDGIFTVPIAIIGFGLFPGTPYQFKKIWWLSRDQHALALTRLERSGIKPPSKLSLSMLKKVISRWPIYYFSVFWIMLNVIALPDGLGFPLWLKSKSPETYTIQQVNNYPTIQAAVGIVAQWILVSLSDYYSIYPIISFVHILFIISYASLAAWNIPDGYRWFCFMIIGFDGVIQALLSGWINIVCRGDAEQRAIVLGVSDSLSQVMTIWTNIVFFPTSQAPEFRRGYIIVTCGAFIMLLLPIWGYFAIRRDERKLSDFQQQGDLYENGPSESQSISDSLTNETQEIHALSEKKA